jgi:phosphoribosylformimino-5-aminoimidazole carboxamide ribotide isomerase
MLIIPAIDLQNGEAVRLYQGDYTKKTVYSRDPVELACQFEQMGALYLHIVDLDGAKNGGMENLSVIARIREAVRIPLQVGGGIRTAEDVSRYLNILKINRVILGTAAVQNPGFLGAMINIHGAERIIASVDVRRGKVAISGWLEESGKEYLPFIQSLIDMGARYAIVTDITKDGTLTEPGWAIYEQIKGINVIIAGGVGSEADIARASDYYGIIVGRAFYEGKVDLEKCFQNESLKG